MNLRFTKQEGDILVSSNIPGVIIVPPNTTLEQAEELTDGDFKKAVDKHKKDYPIRPDRLTQELEALHTKIEELERKQKLSDGKPT